MGSSNVQGTRVQEKPQRSFRVKRRQTRRISALSCLFTVNSAYRTGPLLLSERSSSSSHSPGSETLPRIRQPILALPLSLLPRCIGSPRTEEIDKGIRSKCFFSHRLFELTRGTFAEGAGDACRGTEMPAFVVPGRAVPGSRGEACKFPGRTGVCVGTGGNSSGFGLLNSFSVFADRCACTLSFFGTHQRLLHARTFSASSPPRYPFTIEGEEDVVHVTVKTQGHRYDEAVSVCEESRSLVLVLNSLSPRLPFSEEKRQVLCPRCRCTFDWRSASLQDSLLLVDGSKISHLPAVAAASLFSPVFFFS